MNIQPVIMSQPQVVVVQHQSLCGTFCFLCLGCQVASDMDECCLCGPTMAMRSVYRTKYGIPTTSCEFHQYEDFVMDSYQLFANLMYTLVCLWERERERRRRKPGLPCGLSANVGGFDLTNGRIGTVKKCCSNGMMRCGIPIST
ncbi:hypothetical protein JD844_026347 [Phrynosoma platyrhinos]|uniref:Uncharacterized protein n=1 Tax=Phrynosoma platyrhinos TaxID=52577 RepID=A0ABQ7SEU4_PHRPL|nr:hypothetical protein JD844_026347 [Phrynosoma platyrhinos]